jgi:cAMP-dependent protein kinase regulator
LFQEGEDGVLFYIVKEGLLEVTSDTSSQCKYFKPGDTFGEVALVHNYKRTSNVKCVEKAKLYFLEGNVFRKIIVDINKVKLKDRIYFLSLIKIFGI